MIGWLGNIFIILGILGVAYHHRWGFLLGILGNALWGLKGFLTGQYDLISIEIVVTAVQLFAYINWGRQNVGPICPVCSRTNTE